MKRGWCLIRCKALSRGNLKFNCCYGSLQNEVEAFLGFLSAFAAVGLWIGLLHSHSVSLLFSGFQRLPSFL